MIKSDNESEEESETAAADGPVPAAAGVLLSAGALSPPSPADFPVHGRRGRGAVYVSR